MEIAPDNLPDDPETLKAMIANMQSERRSEPLRVCRRPFCL